jgi:hypothetical protein
MNTFALNYHKFITEFITLLFINLGSNSNESSSNEDLTKSIENEIECLKNMQILLQKKYRLMSIMQKELTQSKCLCINNSNNNIYSHLRKCEFNCQMWFRQIKLIEAKIKCNKELVPFDPLTIARQLLENNELNLNWNSIEVDINNNDVNNTHIKIEKFKDNDESNDLTANDCSISDESYENPFIDLRNMHTLGYDLSLSINSSIALQPINSNEMTTTTEMDYETRTFHELHPISSNVGLNYSAHEISLMRSNALLQHEFDCNTSNHISHDLLPQITAVEIDQILNN